MLTVPQKLLLSVLTGLAVICGSYGQTAARSDVTRQDLIRYQIRNLRPDLAPAEGDRLAAAIDRGSDGCPVTWHILLSIAYKESSLRVGVLGRLKATTLDYGLMQINAGMARKLGASHDKLLADPAYSVQVACHILSDNHARYAARVPYWLGMYRAGTRLDRPEIRRNAQAYDRMIRTLAKRLGYRAPRFAQR